MAIQSVKKKSGRFLEGPEIFDYTDFKIWLHRFTLCHSPLPAGERDSVRGNSVDCKGGRCVCIVFKHPWFERDGIVIYLKEETMILKILLGLILGGLAGFLLSFLTRSTGSAWALTCNPYISIPLGAFVGLLVALG